MSSQFSDHRVLSRPAEVWWEGWRTTTTDLQRNGWELAVDRDLRRMTYTLLLKHRMMKLYAITSEEKWDDFSHDSYGRMPVFHVQQIAPRFETVAVQSMDWSGYQQIDAMPCMAETERKSIEDFNIFHVPLTRAEEIIIDTADLSVIDHLNAIKELQSEQQKDIRQRILREGSHREGRGAQPKMDVVANLVSIAA